MENEIERERERDDNIGETVCRKIRVERIRENEGGRERENGLVEWMETRGYVYVYVCMCEHRPSLGAPPNGGATCKDNIIYVA